MDIMKEYQRWLEQELEDAALTGELQAIQGQEGEISDRFYTDLEFGTAGLRGVLGAGINRMNIYTVRRATQAYADVLKARFQQPTAAVAYDSRINSELFARETARVFAANGIKTWLYGELMPTPALSYAVRELGCCAGINITASHNPSKYNGYKAYDENGCQITGETADAVMARIKETDLFTGVKLCNYDAAIADGSIEIIGEALIQKFLDRVLEEQVNPGLCKDAGLKLVYTPLNGAGRRSVLTVLKKMGITDITVVPEQEWPDGNFPTCPYPNPEILQAMQKGLDLVEKLGADLLLATDPDCDRVGAPPSSKTALPASSPATRWAASLSTTSPAPGRKTALCRSARWWLRASFPPPWRMPSARSTALRSEIPSPALSTSGSRLRSWRRPGKRSGTSWALRKAMATFPVAMSGIRTRWMVRCLSVRWPPGTAPRGRTWERPWTRCTKSLAAT